MSAQGQETAIDESEDNYPALLTENGYFTDWPKEEDRMSALDDFFALYDALPGEANLIDECRAELAALREAVKDAYVYLAEWRSTPFFDSHDEWEAWAKNLSGRVDIWLDKYAPEGGQDERTGRNI